MEQAAETTELSGTAGESPQPRYLNRELSWLDFDERVLELAEDARVPLLERVKFLAIYTTGLDEFFMVRVAGLHDQVEAGVDARAKDGLSAGETIELIARRVRELERRRCSAFERVILPALGDAGIRIRSCEACDQSELAELDRLFHKEIFPVLTPLAVGPGRPFPYISNLSLSLAVWLRDPVTRLETFARVKVPKEVLPRFLPIGRSTFVPMEELIARHLDDLFPGMEIVHHSMFRVTRDADFTVSDEADDLLRAVEDELRRRRFGEVVRLELGSGMDPDLRARLIAWLDVEEHQVYDVDGLLDMGDLWQIHGLEGHPDLRDPAWTPMPQPAAVGDDDGEADMFAAMREGDLLVHHPYQSFSGTVERFVAQAVTDPDVLAIKLTVYRTSDDSSLVPALIEAAERGKQAVCLVELKARFDERRNIGWARALEEAGAHVVHGLPGLKTHAKALLVVRREAGGVRHYVHIATGNYHGVTARIYEDFGLFTVDPAITADVADLFNSLTGYARPRNHRKVIVAPGGMRERLLAEIRATADAARAGEPARIVMKMNSLVDRPCIDALYAAAAAGVRVDLIVRGICCVVPDLDNMRVVSIVGRFLEHSRVYSFQRGDERRYFIGSADLMPRNLDSRVELLVPVEDLKLCDELQDTLERCLADDASSWDLGDDRRWRRRSGGSHSVQEELMQRAAEASAALEREGS
ncbi:MAG TPA: polyphosphate kinase 1 [Thermoleophilaceae bacterium]|nr:polyphosphate kinase 1 [Thermoleophilaceae bacterium]